MMAVVRRALLGSPACAPKLHAALPGAALQSRQQRLASASASRVASAPSDEEIAKLVLNHRTLLSRLPSTRCTIAGVSFEGRQDRVKQLRKNTPVLLVPEPSNVHDSLAVGVQTLAGGRLGFVPRAHNPTFLGRGFTPGFVVSVGQPQSQLLEDESKALWGALIWTSPSAVPLLPQPLPAALRPPAAGQAPSPELEQLRRLLAASGEQDGPAAAALRASKGTCELTAVPASDEAPLRLVPLWRLDLQKRAVQLLRLCVATAPVARAFEFLGMAPGQPDYDQSRRLIEQFNQWRPSELDDYVAWARRVQQDMDDAGAEAPWTVDLTPRLLRTEGAAL